MTTDPYENLTNHDKERIIINQSCIECGSNVELNVARFRAKDSYKVMCERCFDWMERGEQND